MKTAKVWLVHIQGLAIDEAIFRGGESYPISRDTHIITVHGTWENVLKQLDTWIAKAKPIIDSYDSNIIDGVPAEGYTTKMQELMRGYPKEPVLSCCFGLGAQFWAVVSLREIEMEEA